MQTIFLPSHANSIFLQMTIIGLVNIVCKSDRSLYEHCFEEAPSIVKYVRKEKSGDEESRLILLVN